MSRPRWPLRDKFFSIVPHGGQPGRRGFSTLVTCCGRAAPISSRGSRTSTISASSTWTAAARPKRSSCGLRRGRSLPLVVLGATAKVNYTTGSERSPRPDGSGERRYCPRDPSRRAGVARSRCSRHDRHDRYGAVFDEPERVAARSIRRAGVAAAAIGLYAVLSFSVANRTREIGIRLALGADASNVFAVVVRDGLLFVLVGIVLGIAGALAGARVLASFLYGVPRSMRRRTSRSPRSSRSWRSSRARFPRDARCAWIRSRRCVISDAPIRPRESVVSAIRQTASRR
jgi:hypothetical protein